MTNTFSYFLAVIAAVAALIAVSFYQWQVSPVLASSITGMECQATTTAPSALFGARTAASGALLTGPGTLCSVVITGANTGILNFYDATTTDITQRAASMSTSSILIASFPASTAAKDFIIDVQTKYGLSYDLFGGIMPTTTITYRR